MKKNIIESIKQLSREHTKLGEIKKATELFNTVWDLEHGFKRNDRKNKRFLSQKSRSLY